MRLDTAASGFREISEWNCRIGNASPADAAARAHQVAAKVIQGYGALVEIDAGR